MERASEAQPPAGGRGHWNHDVRRAHGRRRRGRARSGSAVGVRPRRHALLRRARGRVLRRARSGALARTSTGAAQARSQAIRVHWRGLAIAAFAACFTGGFQIAHKVALDGGAHPAHVVAISLGVAAAINLVVLGRSRVTGILDAAREQPVNVIGGGVLAGIGFLLFIYGMGKEGAGAVLTLRNTSILFAQLFASLMGDRPNRLGFAGAMSVFAGAALLAV